MAPIVTGPGGRWSNRASARAFLQKLIVLAALLAASTLELRRASAENPWEQITHPTAGSPEAIGGYESGCLAGGVRLPREGPGYRTADRSRHRQYGHSALTAFVKSMGIRIRERGLGTVVIGDLSQPRGGPMPSSHRSHQIGLDVDITYPTNLRGARRALVLQAAAEFPEVDRIFVSVRIKRALCADYKRVAWLHKIRPWWGHTDHFHVRLACPKRDALCRRQEPIPPGDGCDASLAWWFTEEAAHPEKLSPAPPPSQPIACAQILGR